MFLLNDNTVPERGETKAAHHCQQVLDILLPNPNIYPRVEKWSGLMGPIVWQGREYPSGVLPPENVIWEILWELYKLNIIHELQSLDHHACHNLDLLNTTQLFDRQIEISQCFHTSLFWHVPVPSENRGLADNDFDKCFGFITGLVFVMHSWKRDKPALLAGNLSKLELSPNAAMELEEVVAKYYCQQFFNYFGHAAQVPHHWWHPIIPTPGNPPSINSFQQIVLDQSLFWWLPHPPSVNHTDHSTPLQIRHPLQLQHKVLVWGLYHSKLHYYSKLFEHWVFHCTVHITSLDFYLYQYFIGLPIFLLSISFLYKGSCIIA